MYERSYKGEDVTANTLCEPLEVPYELSTNQEDVANLLDNDSGCDTGIDGDCTSDSV